MALFGVRRAVPYDGGIADGLMSSNHTGGVLLGDHDDCALHHHNIGGLVDDCPAPIYLSKKIPTELRMQAEARQV